MKYLNRSSPAPLLLSVTHYICLLAGILMPNHMIFLVIWSHCLCAAVLMCSWTELVSISAHLDQYPLRLFSTFSQLSFYRTHLLEWRQGCLEWHSVRGKLYKDYIYTAWPIYWAILVSDLHMCEFITQGNICIRDADYGNRGREFDHVQAIDQSRGWQGKFYIYILHWWRDCHLGDLWGQAQRFRHFD